MCQAIIRVLYPKNDYQIVLTETEDDLKEKIAALQDNGQVQAYTVYKREMKRVRSTVWEKLP